MPKVQANGISIYYEYMGEGDVPLALVGGSLFGRQNFGLVWEGLGRHFKLISYDQRGYGLSDRPLQSYTMELWADDLAALLDELGIERAHIMGTSAGGMIALQFAAKYPRPRMYRRRQRLRVRQVRHHAQADVSDLAPYGADLGMRRPSLPIMS